MKHLLTVISPHGYGHLAQTGPVVNALRDKVPELRLTVRTTIAREVVARYIACEFRYVAESCDFGLAMASALDVLLEESALRYTAFHRNWKQRVVDEARRLHDLSPDLLLSNVPYLPLAAAARAGIPALALCSLNWADMYHHYFSHRPEADTIHTEMLEAYNGARCFIQPQPAMPMARIARLRPVGPIARRGVDRRAAIARRADIPPGARLVLVALGGIDIRLDVDTWPAHDHVYWLVPQEWRVRHPRAIAMERLGVDHIDLVRSCDALIGKPGYGAFTEAACNGLPVIYASRGDWPEEPFLVDWLERHGRAVPVTREALEKGELMDLLEHMWSLPAPQPPEPTGVAEAAAVLREYLA